MGFYLFIYLFFAYGYPSVPAFFVENNILREVGSAGVGWRDGEKMQTTVIE